MSAVLIDPVGNAIEPFEAPGSEGGAAPHRIVGG